MGGPAIPNSDKLKIALAFHFGEDKSVNGVSVATGISKWRCSYIIGQILDNLANPE